MIKKLICTCVILVFPFVLIGCSEKPDVDLCKYYNKKNIVSFDEFDFGDYYILVKIADEYLHRLDQPLFTYAILGKGIKSIDEGRELYNKLNNKYLVEMPYYNYEYIDENEEIAREEVDDFIFKSHVVQISEDGNKLLRLKYNKAEDYQSTYQQQTWIYEIVEKGKVVFTYNKLGQYNDGYTYPTGESHGFDIKFDDFNGYFSYYSDPSYYFSFKDGTKKPLKPCDYITIGGFKPLSNGEQYLIQLSTEEGIEVVIISTQKGVEIGRYKISDKYGYVEQYVNLNKILYMNSVKSDNDYSNELFTYDIAKGSSDKVGDFMYDASVSPDEKFIAYRTPTGYEIDMNTGKFPSKYDGLYILNTVTGEEYRYEYDIENSAEIEVLSWSSAYGVAKLILEN